MEETLFLMELTVKKLSCVAELMQPYFTEDVLDLQKVCDRYERYKLCAHLLIDQVYYLQQYQDELYTMVLENPRCLELTQKIDLTMDLVERGAHSIFDKFRQVYTKPLWVVCFAKEYLERLQWILDGNEKILNLIDRLRQAESLS